VTRHTYEFEETIHVCKKGLCAFRRLDKREVFMIFLRHLMPESWLDLVYIGLDLK